MESGRSFGVTTCGCALLLALSAPLGACDSVFGGESGSSGRTNRGPGEECGSNTECRPGLVCEQRVCSFVEQPENSPCTVTAECGEGLYCQSVPTGTGGVVGLCAQAGSATLGEACSTAADCEKGLYCKLFGFAGTCEATGSADVGAECTDSAECLAGLSCGPSGMCGQSVVPPGLVFYEGATCPEPEEEDTGEFRVLFEVPRSGEPVSSFYSLPFPNDIRLRNGGVDLSGHPHPELEQVGNVLKTVVDLVQEDVSGFGPHQTVFFRFSAFPQPVSIEVSGDNPVLALVDIDPDSPDYGQRLSLSWSATDGRGKFICPNWLGVRPFWTQPFQSGTTYAAIMTTGLRGPNDEVPVQSPDFAAVIGDAEPGDSDLAAAWRAYAPLRDYLADQSVATATIAAAAVFTIGEPTADLPAIREGVEANGVPDYDDLVLCEDGVVSPCDDGLEGEEHVRGCFSESEDYYEIHTRIDIPIYQEGTPPYLETGGAFVYDEDGLPIRQRTESVCAAITVPRGNMPEAGWPVVVYAHGTGGGFRSHINSYGSDLAEIGYAAIGYDGIQHGERRGETTLEPDVLFFNYANPRAVLGGILQGAVDVMALGRFAAGFSVSAGESPTGNAIDFDEGALVFFGHSQGAIVGPPGLAYDDVYVGAVLSGGGGGLMLSLLNKSNPIDIATGIQAVLQDGELTEFHPVLNLIQLYFEPVDTINYGPGLITERPEGMLPYHLFASYGLGDTYTPNVATQQLAHVIGLPVLTPELEDFGRPTVTPPVTGNVMVEGGDFTVAMGQYTPPEGRDGHFVVFDVDAARTQVLGFLETLASDGVPTIPVP